MHNPATVERIPGGSPGQVVCASYESMCVDELWVLQNGCHRVQDQEHMAVATRKRVQHNQASHQRGYVPCGIVECRRYCIGDEPELRHHHDPEPGIEQGIGHLDQSVALFDDDGHDELGDEGGYAHRIEGCDPVEYVPDGGSEPLLLNEEDGACERIRYVVEHADVQHHDHRRCHESVRLYR